MSEGYNFIAKAIGPAEPALLQQKVDMYSMWLIAGLVAVAGLAARSALLRSNNLVPEKTLTVKNFFDLVSEFLIKLSDNTMGKHNRKYLPFVATLFIYVLFMNFLGLVPGFTMPTHRVTINAGLAIVVFLMYNYWGIKEVGIVNYLKHLWGPMFLVGFLLFPIEIVSHCIRPISLSLRLFGNMTGDHLALEVFTNLTGQIGKATGWLYLPIPVIFYFLGLMVCCIQAFIFAVLTMIYISLATAHEEHHEHQV